MTRVVRSLVFGALAGLAPSGCARLSSTEVANDELNLVMIVTATADDTLVEAVLNRGQGLGANPVEVTGDESLAACSQAVEVELEPVEGALGNISYASLLGIPTGGENVYGLLTRTADDSLLGSVVGIPADFEIVTPAEGDTVVGTGGLVVLWEPANAEGVIDVEITGDCITGGAATSASDLGEITIPEESLVATESCAATLVLTRRAVGTLDSGFGAGGGVAAQQVRGLNVVISPSASDSGA